MTYKIFKRSSWRRGPVSRYTGKSEIVPAPKPIDACRTIATVDTFQEARDYCTERNNKRPQSGDHALLAPFYEFTKI